MKKIFLSLLLLLVSTGATFAQSSLLATLSHEGEITVFYGADALKDAHAAAQHGDAITLSSGSFNAVNITKAITLRGAGCEQDTVRNILPTIIEGDFNITIGEDIPQKLTIEGIHSDYRIEIRKGLNNATFVKNYFNLILYATSEKFKNNSYIQCRFDGFAGNKYVVESTFNFINCIFNDGFNNNEVSSTFTNCIIFSTTVTNTNFNNIKYATLHNCILVGCNERNYDILPSTTFAVNCVGINVSTTHGNGKFDIYNYSPTNSYSTFQEMFGKDSATYPYILTEDAKAKFLGNDGTEVGIYGEPFPFSTTTSNPKITKCNVASRSTADGKLSIDIEVEAGE